MVDVTPMTAGLCAFEGCPMEADPDAPTLRAGVTIEGDLVVVDLALCSAHREQIVATSMFGLSIVPHVTEDPVAAHAPIVAALPPVLCTFDGCEAEARVGLWDEGGEVCYERACPEHVGPLAAVVESDPAFHLEDVFV